MEKVPAWFTNFLYGFVIALGVIAIIMLIVVIIALIIKFFIEY